MHDDAVIFSCLCHSVIIYPELVDVGLELIDGKKLRDRMSVCIGKLATRQDAREKRGCQGSRQLSVSIA
jgi:hypothetical protein